MAVAVAVVVADPAAPGARTGWAGYNSHSRQGRWPTLRMDWGHIASWILHRADLEGEGEEHSSVVCCMESFGSVGIARLGIVAPVDAAREIGTDPAPRVEGSYTAGIDEWARRNSSAARDCAVDGVGEVAVEKSTGSLARAEET